MELRGVGKRFHGVEALAGIDLEIHRGTIHALVGENGAGKSTLGKIISGVHQPDRGEVRVDGRPVRYGSPRDALADGITVISQELSLVPQLTVLENVFLGTESARSGVLRPADMRRRFDQLVERSGFGLPPDAVVGDLRLADQKKVEILRAVARNARLIVMDEPTAALSAADTDILLQIVRNLRRAGTTIVYVSHFLEEVLDLADTVTVLRNGRLIRTAPAAGETPDSLITAMLGRSLDLTFPPKTPPAPDAPVVLSVEGLTRAGVIEDVSFEIRAGEIVGLAGLVGSGRSEVARAIFGADPVDRGTVLLDGRPVRIRSPRDAVRAGIAMLPESRKLQGLVMNLSAAHNVTLPHLEAVAQGPILCPRAERGRVQGLLEDLDVRPPDPDVPVMGLSGGNQQKVLFAKWLFRRPRVLIADEPTEGVDVGAKRSIYELLHRLAAEGMVVLLISSDLTEVLALSHRVLAMRLGRIVAAFDGDGITEDAVMRAIFAHEQESGMPA